MTQRGKSVNPYFTFDQDQIDYLVEGFESSQAKMSPYATRDKQAIYEEGYSFDWDDALSYIRPPFIADVDRIEHNPFYTRTFDKTQVFALVRNDNISRRGFHIQLVAQTAMKIGAALRLNTPLIQAIGLGHDAGHTPFGHAGEQFLSDLYHERTGRFFNHNVHSVRALKDIAPCHLSLQTYNGMLSHCGENNFAKYTTAPCDSFEALSQTMEECYLLDGYSSCLRPSTLEGCVVRISDILAYLGKDRQDALEMGIISVADYPIKGSFLGKNNTDIIRNVSINIIKNSLDRDCIQMDEEVSDEIRRLKGDNFSSIYNYDSEEQRLLSYIRPMMTEMYQRLRDDVEQGREESPIFTNHINAWFIGHRNKNYFTDNSVDDIVCDYIASMTDDYFVASYRNLFPDDPKSKADLYKPYF